MIEDCLEGNYWTPSGSDVSFIVCKFGSELLSFFNFCLAKIIVHDFCKASFVRVVYCYEST